MHSIGMLRAAALGAGLATALSGAALAGEYNITVDRVKIDTGEFTRSGVGFDGSSPGPVLRFQEGEDVTIHVKNNLDEPTSIHWHGLILPYQQDGVPGLTFEGIGVGATHTYRFPMSQSGTYWYHSHSGFQEPDGAYGAIIIEPKDREPFRYDRDYVVQFTDAHPHHGSRIFRNLKSMPDYYNRQQRTLVDLVQDAREEGLGAALAGRLAWGGMRMMPTDIEDVQGFTALINGEGPEENWTGIFKPGERVRLRLINSSAMTYFDVRIPGLEMTVVQADGQNVQPVTVDELRIGVAETYDVIVRPTEERAYTIFAESMARSAYARGTLAPREGMEGEIPELREPYLLTMADMGMAHGDHSNHGAMVGSHTMPDGSVMQGGAHGTLDHGSTAGGSHRMPDGSIMQGPAHQGTGHGPAGGDAHIMPDGSLMQGAAHQSARHGTPSPGAHTMPDSAVTQVASHEVGTEWPTGGWDQLPDSSTKQGVPQSGIDHGPGGAGMHTMPNGSTMQGPAHQGTGHGSTAGGMHRMPDGSITQGPAHQGTDHGSTGGGMHRMPDGSMMQGPAHQGMDHGSTGGGMHRMPNGSMMQGPAQQSMDHGSTGGGMHMMPDGSVMQGPTHQGMEHGSMEHGASAGGDPFYVAGSGLTPEAATGGRFLSYADLKALKPLYPDREPTREIELRLTGNMERYIWSINGVKFDEADPIRLRYGERVRFKFVNETMMTHPMHLHGMWSILQNGSGRFNPAKHVISVAPGTTVTMETEVDAEGVWALHCHLAYHMDAGMMRKVIVEGGPLGFTAESAPDFGPVHNVVAGSGS